MTIPGGLLIGLLAIQCGLLAAAVLLYRRRAISPVLSAGIAILVGLWYLLPVAIRLIFGRVSWIYRLVPDEVFAQMALLEGICLLAVLLLLLLLRRRRNADEAPESRSASRPEFDARWVLIVLALGWLVDLVIRWHWSGVFGADYRTRNALGVAPGTDAVLATFSGAVFVETLFGSFAAAAALASRWQTRWDRALLVASWLSVLAISVWGAASGGRLALFAPAVLGLLWLREAPRVSPAVRVLIVLVIGAYCLLAGTVSLSVGRQREGGAIELQRVVKASGQEVAAALTSPDTKGAIAASPSRPGARAGLWVRVAREALMKFDSISAGALLLRVEGVGAAGWAPFEGAVLALIPRVVYPGKPVPGSRTGDLRGHPSRIAARAEGGDPNSSNVGVSPSAVALWELGIVGVVLLVAANTFNLLAINALLLSPNLFIQSVGISLVSVPSFVTLFVPADTVILNLQRAAVLVAAVLLGTRLLGRTPLARILNRDAAAPFEGEQP